MGLKPIAYEVILSDQQRVVTESFLFEPAQAEAELGRLYIVAELEQRAGGQELIEKIVQSIQLEYFRDPGRGILASFESALHQANLVLHSWTETGQKEWMSSLHVAISVIAGAVIHISTAGKGAVWLVRQGRVSPISQDLSYSPITKPLSSFGQVASGTVVANDVLYLGTSEVAALFSEQDLSVLATGVAIEEVGQRVQMTYRERNCMNPLGVVIVGLEDDQNQVPVVSRKEQVVSSNPPDKSRSPKLANLQPRQPIEIERSLVKSLVGGGTGLIKTGAKKAFAMTKSRKSATVKSQWKKGKDKKIQLRIPRPNLKKIVRRSLEIWFELPRTSKVLASFSAILLIILVVSIFVLREKRASDEAIQRASELLHDARIKQEAAETALIYDNRDQARQLIKEAGAEVADIKAKGVYEAEVAELEKNLNALQDSLQSITRTSNLEVVEVGTWDELAEGDVRSLNLVGEDIFTFEEDSNRILKMTRQGAVNLATDKSSGIGFLETGVAHAADKTVVYRTSDPGIAIFDAKENSLSKQEISLPAEGSNIRAHAVFGSRLYVYDATTKNIYSFSKSLRGYGSGSVWITDGQAPKDDIVGLTVDGSIYTLHNDGSVREFFKGEQVPEFELETIEPSLAGANWIATNELWRNLYVFDRKNARLVVLDKSGSFKRQIKLDIAEELIDVVISEKEDVVYVLDELKVLAVPLTAAEE